MRTSDVGIDALCAEEGFVPRRVRDAKGWSIGYGHFLRPGESHSELTEPQARELLALDIRWAEHCVGALVRVPLRQCQYDALVSLVYNIGAGRFGRSILLSRINAHAAAGIRKEWSEFRLSSVLVSPPGVVPERFETRVDARLVARRARELAMYFSGGE